MKSALIRLTATVGVVGFTPAAVAAQTPKDEVQGGIDLATGGAAAGSPSFETIVQNVIDILLWVVGIASVVMLIVGGIRYVVSAGDQNAVQGAKNTILYAIVGLVISLLAFTLVNFVVTETTT